MVAFGLGQRGSGVLLTETGTVEAWPLWLWSSVRSYCVPGPGGEAPECEEAAPALTGGLSSGAVWPGEVPPTSLSQAPLLSRFRASSASHGAVPGRTGSRACSHANRLFPPSVSAALCSHAAGVGPSSWRGPRPRPAGLLLGPAPPRARKTPRGPSHFSPAWL